MHILLGCEFYGGAQFAGVDVIHSTPTWPHIPLDDAVCFHPGKMLLHRALTHAAFLHQRFNGRPAFAIVTRAVAHRQQDHFAPALHVHLPRLGH